MTLFSFPDLRSSGSRRAAFVLAAGLGFGAATSGCFVVTDGGSSPLPPSTDPAQESIDADAVIAVSPGQGAGLFVQYASGGQWDVFTSCDTDITDRPCSFDIIISADPTVVLAGPKPHDFEVVDTLTLESDGSIHVITGTAGKLDGVSFSAEPGASIRVDVLLDGAAQPDYVHWISGGVYQDQGALTNPVDFVPASP
jgi:hypothetical protein